MSGEREEVSVEEYRELAKKSSARRRRKYNNEPVIIDGRRFDSIAEGTRYSHLKLLRDAGEISDLQCQTKFPLHVRGHLLGEYRADFTYRDANGTFHVEDVKGVRTDVYKWKKRHVWAEYGLMIEEIT
ncbi:MAG: DUF1064 domain-containing protein [Actinomycetota bacterium]|nr:DUF1064 domain-containing protein [Actinomycetota bacterium]